MLVFEALLCEGFSFLNFFGLFLLFGINYENVYWG